MPLPSLFIDKLAVTISLEADRQSEVHDAANDAIHEWDEFVVLENPRSSGYRSKFSFTVANGGRASLFFQPTNPRNNYFKLEYSPNNFGGAGLALLGEYLQQILGDTYLTDIREADLRRLDVAFDVRRVRLKDLLITDRDSRKSIIYRGEQGEAETFYFPPDGKRQLCVYDKLKEDLDKRGPSAPNRRRAPWVRFEFRFKSLSNYTLNSIAGRLENPFQNFEVRHFGITQPRIPAERLRMFFDGCRLAGVDSVLEEITDTATRDYLALAYRSLPVPNFWLRRTSIWGRLPRAIENALPR
jgi:hypothetical protein